MAILVTNDGVSLYYEQTGTGQAIVWVHEFAGDHRSWEPQVRHFARSYNCISFAARGYPPSEVPQAVAQYSQERAMLDIAAVMDAAGVKQAHVVGLSMGGFAALHFALNFPTRTKSLTVAGVGYGAEPELQEHFKALALQAGDQFERLGCANMAEVYGSGVSRVQLKHKDPRGWAEFVQMLAAHDSLGSANTMRGVQASRPSIYTLKEQLRKLAVPTLVVCGDEDDHCLQPSIFLKQNIPAAGLLVLPKTGHTINLEEPYAFNRALEEFFTLSAQGLWWQRDFAATEQIMQLMDESD